MGGQIYSTPVNLTNIDKVPVTIVHPVQDEVCDSTMVEWTYAQMQQEEKYIRFEHGGHLLFAIRFNTPDAYMQRMVETIDHGTTVSGASVDTILQSALFALMALSATFI